MQNETFSLKRPSDLEFLTRLNTMLSTRYDDPQYITSALGLIGGHTRHDRIVVIGIRHNTYISILHEWHRNGLRAIDQSASYPMPVDKQMEEQLYTQNFITFDAENETLSHELKVQLDNLDGKQMTLFPLQEAGEQFAFIAYVQCLEKHACNPDDLPLLAMASSLIATSLHKEYLLDKLKHQLLLCKKHQQKAALLDSELNTLNEQLQPTWHQLKGSLGQTGNREQLELFGQYLHSLDKLCRSTAIK